MFQSTFGKIRMMFYVGFFGMLVSFGFLTAYSFEYGYSKKGKVVEGRVSNTEIVKQTIQHSRRGIPTHTTEEDRLRITFVFQVPDRSGYEYSFQDVFTNLTQYQVGDKLQVEYYPIPMNDRGMDIEGRIKRNRISAGLLGLISLTSFIATLGGLVYIGVQPTVESKKSSTGKKTKTKSTKLLKSGIKKKKIISP